MNILQKFEAKQFEQLTQGKALPAFSPGDTVRVNVKVLEGTRERIQAYEGVCIARAGSGPNASFTVRKISYGEGVERVFPLYSPRVDSIEVVRRGSVRRAKLYYLRDRRGKSARITERTTGHGMEDAAPNEEIQVKAAQPKKKSPPTGEAKAEKPKKAPAAKKKAE